MNSLLVVGAGSFSSEVEEIASILGYEELAFLDDNPSEAYCYPVIGKTKDVARFRNQYDNAIVALGNNDLRMKYHQELKHNQFTIPVLIHPTAYVSPTALISPGCIIRAKAVVSRNVKIGEACILNVGVLVDHHVMIGDYCHILMGAVLRNRAKIEPLSRVESLSVVQ